MKTNPNHKFENIVTEYIPNSPFKVTVIDEVDSTNAYLKEKAKSGDLSPAVVIAKRQTSGRGRLGRDFFSPAGTGMYMSVLISDIRIDDNTHLITAAAAVAASRAVDDMFNVHTGIKWVNDIYLGKKKIAGILLEVKSDKTPYAVLGIGVNISDPYGGFPDELVYKAGSVLGEKCAFEDAPYKLAGNILHHLLPMIESLERKEYIAEYKSKSILTGKDVTLLNGGIERCATVLGIDDDGALVVKSDEKREHIISGDVSVRDFFD